VGLKHCLWLFAEQSLSVCLRVGDSSLDAPSHHPMTATSLVVEQSGSHRAPLLENVAFEPILGLMPRLLGLWVSVRLGGVLLVYFCRGQVPKNKKK
jgi:hypothetical protein